MRFAPRVRLGLAVGLSATLLGPGRSTLAQDTLSFSTVEISAGASLAVRAGTTTQFWRTGPGLHLAALTPYGVGALRFGLEMSHHAARSLDLPSYLSVFPSIEWGLGVDLPLGLSGYGGAGLGAYWMSFSKGRNARELEMAISGTALVRRPVWGAWTLGLGAHARRVLLDRPLDEVGLLVQIGRTSRAPSSLKRAFLGALPSSPNATERAPAGTQIAAGATSMDRWKIDEVDLRDGAVTRLSDVFRAIPHWDQTTLDHRTSWATPEGLAPFESGADVLVDGVPIPLDVFGSLALDRLPLALSDVELIDAPGTPGLHQHRFRRHGLLHFTTRLPTSDGLAVYGEAIAENATDDPGPFIYTDSTAQNVDKVGTGYAAGAVGRRGPLAAAIGFKYLSDFLTDAGLGGRPISLRDPDLHYPVIRTYASWASLRFEGERGKHALRAGHSLRTDYHFLPVLGFEVPTEMRFWHVGAAGEVRIGGGFRWRYQAHSSGDHLADVPNELNLAFDLRASRRGLAAELVRDGRLELALGAGIDAERMASGFLPAARDWTTVRMQGSALVHLGAGRVGVEAELRRVKGELGGDFALEGQAPLPAVGRVHLRVWRSAAQADESRSFWGLHDAGYDFLDSAGVTVDELGRGAARRQDGAYLELEWGTAERTLSVTPFLQISRLSGGSVAQPSFIQEGRRPTHQGPVLLTRSVAGNTLMSGVQLRMIPHPTLRIEARYRWLGPLAGDRVFRSAWSEVPTHRYWQQIGWSLRPDLRLVWGLEARSRTRWAAYSGMGRERLTGSLVTDLSLEKTLWEGRARVCARVADLGNVERALHPLGAAPGLSFALCGAIRAGG